MELTQRFGSQPLNQCRHCTSRDCPIKLQLEFLGTKLRPQIPRCVALPRPSIIKGLSLVIPRNLPHLIRFRCMRTRHHAYRRISLDRFSHDRRAREEIDFLDVTRFDESREPTQGITVVYKYWSPPTVSVHQQGRWTVVICARLYRRMR